MHISDAFRNTEIQLRYVTHIVRIRGKLRKKRNKIDSLMKCYAVLPSLKLEKE